MGMFRREEKRRESIGSLRHNERRSIVDLLRLPGSRADLAFDSISGQLASGTNQERPEMK